MHLLFRRECTCLLAYFIKYFWLFNSIKLK